MELFKKMSAARTVQLSLSVLWIISLIIAILMLGFFVFICFLPEYDPGGWTLMMDPSVLNYPIEPMVDGLHQVRMDNAEFEMGFTSPTRASTIIFQLIRVLVGMYIMLQILFLAKKIAYSWPDKNPFSIKNIIRLRKIALLMIVVPIFHAADLLSTHYFLLSKFDFPVAPGFFINWDLGMLGNILSRSKWEYLLVGVGILALSEVFKKGLEYQEDSTSIL